MTEEPWEDPADEHMQDTAERSGPAWEGDGASPTSFLETLKSVLLAPTLMFQSMRREGGVGSPLLFGLIGSGIGVLAGLVYKVVIGMLTGTLAFAEFAVQLVATPFALVAFFFVNLGIRQLMLMVLGGGQRGIETTLRVQAYCTGSISILVLIPFCGNLLAIPWGIVCEIIGLSEAHEISRGKAALAVLIPIALCCLGFSVIVASTGMLAQYLS